MRHIVSASRRTDIPRFFARWFAERRREGVAAFRNSFGGKGEASLRPQDVLGYLFWTRYAGPFAEQLRELRAEGVPYVFQYTLNAYGRDLEPHLPRTARAVDDFLAVSRDLPSPAAIQWRYDPIVLSDTYTPDFHRRSFRRLARALEGATRVVNVSVVEPYRKTVRRVAEPSVRFRALEPKRHRAVAAKHPDLPQAGADAEALLAELAEMAREHGMELRACCNPEQALPRSQCCGPELFAPYGVEVAREIAATGKGPSRQACRCLRVVDIGMDNTCVAGCKYCYVVTSHEAAVRSFRRHDPAAPMLRS